MYTIWSMFTWVFLPVGGVIALCTLSGFETLEKLGRRICQTEIQIGEVKFTIPFVVSLICGLCFGGEWHSLSRLRHQRARATLEPLEFNDAWRAVLWRHQRNWWLSLSSLILWLIVWRVDGLIQSFRAQIRSIEEQKIALLKDQAMMEEAQKAVEVAQASKPAGPAKSAGEKKRD